MYAYCMYIRICKYACRIILVHTYVCQFHVIVSFRYILMKYNLRSCKIELHIVVNQLTLAWSSNRYH